jgi:hypothetical protein
MAVTPNITVLHELPGRLRVKFSLPPLKPKSMEKAVRDHEGIDLIKYSPVTKTVLVQFDPAFVSREEIVIRMGVFLSLENNNIPVQVFSQPQKEEMSDFAFYSAALLGLGFVSKYILKTTQYNLVSEWAAGVGTAYAVLDHGWGEIKQTGVFHPEVLSLSYLLISMIRGNFLPAAAFTWITTFGRHLVNMPEAGVEIRPVQSQEDSSQVEVSVTLIRSEANKAAMLSLVPAALKYAITGDAGALQGTLIDEIRDVAKSHENVLDSLGKFKEGIPIKIA